MTWNRRPRSTLALIVTALLCACVESSEELTGPPADNPEAAVVDNKNPRRLEQRGKIRLLSKETVEGKVIQTYVVYANKREWESRRQSPPKTLLIKVDGRVSAVIENEYVKNREGSWVARRSRVSSVDETGKLTRTHDAPFGTEQSANQGMVMQADVTDVSTQDPFTEKCLWEKVKVAAASVALVGAIAWDKAKGVAVVAAHTAYVAIILECAVIPDPSDFFCPAKIAAAQEALVAANAFKAAAEAALAAASGYLTNAVMELDQCLDRVDDDEDWPEEGEGDGDGGGSGGGGEGDCPTGQERWCDVDYEYVEETGEITDLVVLGCYCA